MLWPAVVGTVPSVPFPCIRSPALLVVLFFPAFSSPFLQFDFLKGEEGGVGKEWGTDQFHPLYNTIKNSLYHRNTSAFILIAKLFQDNGTMEKMVNLRRF